MKGINPVPSVRVPLDLDSIQQRLALFQQLAADVSKLQDRPPVPSCGQDNDGAAIKELAKYILKHDKKVPLNVQGHNIKV